MPKELTHWHIARAVLQRGVPAQVGELIECNPALYYFGAIAHDIGFYDFSKPTEANIERVANQLHGVDGEDTLDPLIKMMEEALSQNNKRNQIAFILGMLTHFVADSTFHPMVYYMSGNYFAEDPEGRGKAVFRHRLLETAIDLWLENVKPLKYPLDLITLWRETGEAGREALELLVGRYTQLEDENIRKQVNKAWRNHRLLQTAFGWSTPWRILAFYRRLGHPSVDKYEALFYPQPLNLSFFESSLDWLHPVTGAHHDMTLEDLFDESVEKVITLFERLNTQSIEKWPLLIRALEPLSLDSGLPYVPVTQMKYFRTEPIEQGLRIK
ncbi:hypothetical protein E4K67_13405 [Desulfosporosinus fructosivorans]|uniref:Phospholipase C/D domain-containing protein n=1 Tax=Desulfosporosinus fructosivorans TaxID=2018669 RepID=A0A4Z0R3Q9_9FIRM|nr:zinc dependent phospholipase C family protein [Desulfosporosinus fructosivorans]TGE37711.1 hypothetical protein E4K67_13405 [Desulfosporosinus fructosivorans]